MASSGHILQQQKPGVEARIRALVNDDLKTICRAYGYQVSGAKALLVNRCVEALNTAVENGDVKAFEDLRYRSQNRGKEPPRGVIDGAVAQRWPPTGGFQPYNMAPQRNGPGVSQGRPSGKGTFKTSPFYEILETLVPMHDLPEGPEMPQNRHTVKSSLTLRADLAQQCRSDPNLKIMMYCGLTKTMSPHSPADVAFPNQIEVKVNEQEVKANFKGLKNKTGSTKPADLTFLVRKYNGQPNGVSVTYALTTNRFAFAIFLVRYHTKDELAARINKHNIIRKQTVLSAMSKANSDDDIAATSIRMSLKDPVSTLRISSPVRSSYCSHNQCFDGGMFMSLMEQAPYWHCPVCSKAITYDSLCVDEYFQEILKAAPASIEKVDIEPNGEWKVIKEEEDSQTGGPANKPRASYDDDFDDDFDDDIVELDQPVSKPVNGVKRESQSQASLGGRPTALDTPPLSSREPSVAQSATSAQRGSKRPQSAVIDLTLSDDDDDQPVRSARRTNTINVPRRGGNTNNTATTASPYDTPTSLPDPRLQPPQQNHNAHQTNQQVDSYRPPQNPSYPQNQAYGFSAHNSMSPPNINSPVAFGQTSIPSQHSRPFPSPAPPQSYSGYTNGAFAPNSPYRPPSQQPNYQYGYHQQPNRSTSSPAPAGNSGLRLPPMQPPPPYQQQQQHPYASPSAYQGGGWRSDGSEFGGYMNSGSPGG
ncbi:E3 SUMO-protein ligase pli1 [Saxophila tyrrhenica]|uniref:E3 SUMO-protein ligase pli1 n=1 Tax=Saxophila tyrrhenica TaxID=1690608 RepID=A0AAV9P512_9PEZI|nr:E3 SUMO-protein ligase pli1 [Saxophila tyrrhenica]